MPKGTNIDVNTDLVHTAAGSIRKFNNDIDKSFEDDASSEIRTLSSIWKGKVAECAIRKFKSIESNYREPRKNVVEQYVKFLENQVGLGYEETETTNTKNADLFK